MPGRRGCVNSLWSGTERVRISERLKATLAGILELDLLRCQHLEMVSAELVDKDPETRIDRPGTNLKSPSVSRGSVTCRGQQVPSPSETPSPAQIAASVGEGSSSGEGRVHSRGDVGGNSRWSTLSWDAASDLPSPPTPDADGAVQLDCDSRPSSGFYSVSGSSLSDSCYSVSSEAAQGGSGGLARPVPPSGGAVRLWEQRPLSADHSDAQWPEVATQQRQQQPKAPSSEETAEVADRRPVSTGDLELGGLMFLSDLCSSLADPQPGSFLLLPSPSSSSSSPNPRPQLDPRFCSDLVSRRTKEVYPYPSPLHAVALQSPLFTSAQDPSPPARLSPGPDGAAHPGEPPPPAPPPLPAPPSLTQLEQYIARLAQRHHRRHLAASSLTPGPRGHGAPPRTPPSRRHGSTQSLTAFESRGATALPSGHAATPGKAPPPGNAAGQLGLRKASRNSINLGHLPSVTGDDLNINLNLHLHLNPAPEAERSPGSVGALRSDFAASFSSSPSPSSASLSSSFSSSFSSAAPAPAAMRPRPRISTCPSSLSHRSSLEVTGSSGGGGAGFGSLAFSRSLDWSGGGGGGGVSPSTSAVRGPTCSAPGGGPPKLSEDSAVVGEISRLSGLPRAVVIGLMEQGVELDVDCFQSEAEEEAEPTRPGRGSEVANPPRPAQLSLGPTPPLLSRPGLTPPPHSASSPHAGSPARPYQAPPLPAPRHASFYQHHDPPPPLLLPSSSSSSPASRPLRVRSPPRPLHPSPLGPAPLSVFRRDAPFQCSLPRVVAVESPPGGGVRPRGGSLRQGGGCGWRRPEGEGLYQGKHASRELVRAAAATSRFAKRESYGGGGGAWGKDNAAAAPKRGARLWKGFEGRLWGKGEDEEEEEEEEEEEDGGWRESRRRNYRKVKPWKREERQKESAGSKRKGKGGGGGGGGGGVWDNRSSSLRPTRRALFRSESQGVLAPNGQREGRHWASSLDVARGAGLEFCVGGGEEGGGGGGGGRARRGRKGEDKRPSSTANLFLRLSRSQSLEGSCHSPSPPLSSSPSPSLSPSSPPARAPLTRSRSLRDLGRRVFGSVRSLSLKHKTSRK